MYSAPFRIAQALVGFLLPPASREHVLGDFEERYTSPVQYATDVICTVPLVIASRIRRTSDPDVFLMEALGLYVAFLGAAWVFDPPYLFNDWGLVRLAVPAMVILAATTLAAAYTDPRRRSPLQPVREATMGVAFGFLAQAAASLVDGSWAVPALIMATAGGMSLLLMSALRMFFSSAANRPQGATTNGPLLWRNTVTRLMEYVGLMIVVGGFGAMILFIAFLFQNRG